VTAVRRIRKRLNDQTLIDSNPQMDAAIISKAGLKSELFDAIAMKFWPNSTKFGP
jgi:hypothetical protein